MDLKRDVLLVLFLMFGGRSHVEMMSSNRRPILLFEKKRQKCDTILNNAMNPHGGGCRLKDPKYDIAVRKTITKQFKSGLYFGSGNDSATIRS